MRAPRPTLLAPVVAVLLLAGCSSGTPPTAQDDAGPGAAESPATGADDAEAEAEPASIPDDVCSLLTLDEATQAYGGAITTTDRGDSGCVWSGPSTGFSVEFSTLTGDDGWDTMLAVLKATEKDAAVAGVGDRAAGSDGHLVVQTGGTIFSVTAAFSSQDPDAAKAAEVAKAVVDGL